MKKFLVYFCFHNDQPAVVYPEERRGWGWGDSNLFAGERNGSSKPHNPGHAAVSLTEKWQAANYNFEDIGPLFGLARISPALSHRDWDPVMMLDWTSIASSQVDVHTCVIYFSSCIANFKIHKGNFQYDYLMPHCELPSFVYDAKQD